jgi:hypothetical protein
MTFSWDTIEAIPPLLKPSGYLLMTLFRVPDYQADHGQRRIDRSGAEPPDVWSDRRLQDRSLSR